MLIRSRLETTLAARTRYSYRRIWSTTTPNQRTSMSLLILHISKGRQSDSMRRPFISYLLELVKQAWLEQIHSYGEYLSNHQKTRSSGLYMERQLSKMMERSWQFVDICMVSV